MDNETRDRLIHPHEACNCGKETPEEPLYLLFFEETHFVSPHYMSIRPKKTPHSSQPSQDMPTSKTTHSNIESSARQSQSVSFRVSDVARSPPIAESTAVDNNNTNASSPSIIPTSLTEATQSKPSKGKRGMSHLDQSSIVESGSKRQRLPRKSYK